MTDWKENVATGTGSVTRKGYLLAALTLGVFMVWAVAFPLASAVVTLGEVITTGQNKVLQHPLGGVVRMISAEEGAFLEQGDLVATIEPASAKAELAALIASRDLLDAKKTRLMATKNGLENYERPLLPIAELRGSNTAVPSTETTGSLVFKEQEAEFEAGTRRLHSEVSALKNRLLTMEGEHHSNTIQLEQHNARLALLDNQISKLEPLVEQGHVAKIRLWDLEANRLQIKTEIARVEGALDSLIGQMDEIKDQIALTTATREQENSKELTDVLSELASIEERIDAAQKFVEYSEIRAPVAGTLTNVNIHTIGGVVQAGAVIAEIVPKDQPLQIEARVLPQDIGSIALDQDAEVVITAFNRRLEDPLEGKIGYISADSQKDEKTGEPFFVVRINIDPDKKISKRIKTGMSAEVYIQTEARTFLDYLTEPVTDSFRRAFTEK